MIAGRADIPFASVTELSNAIKSRTVSPVELVDAYLERIEALNPSLNAYITVAPEQARREARLAESEIQAGRYRGLLHGIPYGVKDQILTKGIRTTFGSRQMATFVPDFDAFVVDRMSQAGAILLGKHNMSEFAMGDAVEFTFGIPRNPWDKRRKPGSSSSGSAAATSAGLCAVSIAEDTGGSIRGPASYTGLVGLRPTWGRVSRHGVQGLCWSMDTLGPLGRRVADCAIVLGTIAGRDDGDNRTSRLPVADYREALTDRIDGMRVGVLAERLYGSEDNVDPEVKSAVVAAIEVLRQLGATIQDVSVPLTEYSALASLVISMVDGTALHRPRMAERLADYDHNVQAWLLTGSIIPAQAYYKAQRIREVIRSSVLAALKVVDLIVLPTSSTVAPLISVETGTRSVEEARARFTGGRNFFAPFNLAGVPAMSVPCGFTSAGLPIGLQLAGPLFREDIVLRAAHAFEQATTWHERRPPEVTSDR